MIALPRHLFVSACLLLGTASLQAEGRPNSPWDMEKLSKAPAYEWVDQTSSVRSLTYTGEEFQGKPSQVFAYLATPESVGGVSKPGTKHPGIILIHGGGGTAFKVWAELWAKRGYIALAMDLAGSRPDEADPTKRTRLPQGGPDQGHSAKFDCIRTADLSDDWPYHAVANGILAHSLLLSFPGVDQGRTAVTGISWGGYTTCLVASLDDRFKAAVPIYGCGHLTYNTIWQPDFERLGPEDTKKWVSLYDPATYLGKGRVPMFFVNGTNDKHYRIDSYMKSYDEVKSPKNIRIQVNMPHGHEVGWAPKEIGLYIDNALQFRSETSLPSCSFPEVKDGKVTATVAGGPVKSAVLNYALPGPTMHERQWLTVPATVENGIVSAPAPPADSDMYFFNVTDQRDAMVSSVVMIHKK